MKKNKFVNFTDRAYQAAKGALCLLVVSFLIALVVVGLTANAAENSPPVPLTQNVGGSSVDTSIGVIRNNSFLVSGYAGIMITNAGGAGAVICTNDYGCTNLTGFIRQSPGTVLPSGQLYTNALINPYYWMLDAQNAIYQGKTGVRLWKDVDIPVNAGLLAGYSNLVLSIEESGASTATTNQNTFVFLHTVDGRIFDTNDTWTVTGPRVNGTNVNGTNIVVPITFVNGFRRLRMFQLQAGTNSPATTNYIHDISLNGANTF